MTGDAKHDEFPLQYARTGRFMRGAPRHVIPRNSRSVLFLRSADGRSPRGDLWSLDTMRGTETLLVAAESLQADELDLPAAERARRERLREGGAGITAFDISPDGNLVVFGLGGALFLLTLDDRADRAATDDEPSAPRVRLLDVPGPVVDPRVGDSGIAWHAQGRLWVCDLDGGHARAVTPADGAMWGLADFIAAEELERLRGFWWAERGSRLVVARVDESAVPVWWISDPAGPAATPQPHHYPAAGTTNASVSLWALDASDPNDVVEPTHILTVGPDEEYEYLAQVRWQGGPPLAMLLSRDQRQCCVVTFDPVEGSVRVVAQWSDEQWVDVVAGTPRWLADGRVLTVRRDVAADRLRAYADAEAISPSDVQVRSVIGSDETGVILRIADSPVTSDLVRLDADGDIWTLLGGGWFQGTLGHGLLVCTGARLPDLRWQTTVYRPTGDGAAHLHALASHAEVPPGIGSPMLATVGRVRYAVLLPPWVNLEDATSSAPLPVLLLPYGGPHAQRVMAAGPAYAEAAWWAARGYAVLITDGVGTPGVSPSWERMIEGDFATGVLADQIAALDAAVTDLAGLLDSHRVGITGWSFGGYLSALAVLARPDRFHVGVAGAPVTDWRLYDTGYTERYLGHPDVHPEHYAVSSLLDRAGELQRPLLLVHGLADDNVVAAHTLQLSSALLAAGRPHSVLPLTAVTHMTPQPVIAANLLRAQAEFLDTHLHPRRNASASAATERTSSTSPG